MTTRQVQAPECLWPLCRSTTWDPSQYCFHHRRASVANPDPGAAGRFRRRLPDTTALAAREPDSYRRLMERSQAGMERLPRVVVSPRRTPGGDTVLRITDYLTDDPDGDLLFWRGGLHRLPLREPTVAVDADPQEGATGLVVRVRGELTHDVLRNVSLAARYRWLTHHGYRYGYLDGDGEEYDDAAEALAQLQLGDLAGGSLAIMTADPGHPEGTTELIRFLPADPDRPAIAAELRSSYPRYTVEGEVGVRYEIAELTAHPHPGARLPEEYEAMLLAVVDARNVVGRYGLTDPDALRLFLPPGWTDAEPPRFRN